jgi:hypothetical protein
MSKLSSLDHVTNAGPERIIEENDEAKVLRRVRSTPNFTQIQK